MRNTTTHSPIAEPARVVFLGFLGTDAEIEAAFARETAPQRSAINFQRALVGALQDAGASIHTIGTLPVAAYPHNRAFFPGSVHAAGETMPLLNLPGLRMAWRAGSSFWRLLFAGQADAIMVYSLHTPLVIAATAAARVKRARLGIVIPDLPLYMNSGHSGALRAWLKSLDNRLLKWLARRADVVFPITAKIAGEWLNRPSGFVVVEGVSPLLMEPFAVTPERRRPSFLYAGSFSQILKCVAMFSKSTVSAELVLIGAGPEGEALEALAERDARITVQEFMKPDELRVEINKADFLINLRDTTWPGGRYSFPSKLVEYIRQGKPVISTRLDGIPEEYFDYFLPLNDADDAGFSRSIEAAIATGPEQLAAAVSGAQAMLREKKSPAAVGRRMIKALLRD